MDAKAKQLSFKYIYTYLCYGNKRFVTVPAGDLFCTVSYQSHLRLIPSITSALMIIVALYSHETMDFTPVEV